MAVKVTQEEIIQMNEIYAICKNYTQTAKTVGRAPSTVKKYIIDNYIPIKLQPKNEIKIELPTIEDTINSLNRKQLTLLSDKEKEELKEFWKELML